MSLLDRVPREIWQIILLHLPFYEDLVVASLTCTLWRNILANHLVCPVECSAFAHGWKVDQPFVYHFLPGTPPSEKDEKLPLARAVNRWVTWPHIPLCFEIVLRDGRARRPQFKSRAHYGLSVRWIFKGHIPYTERERPGQRSMELDPASAAATTTTATMTSAGIDAMEVAVEPATMERESKRARPGRQTGLTESHDGIEHQQQELLRRQRHDEQERRLLHDDIQQAWQVLGLRSDGGGEGGGGVGEDGDEKQQQQQQQQDQERQQQWAVDLERHLVRLPCREQQTGQTETQAQGQRAASQVEEGQFAFYGRELYMMRGERLKEVVSSLVDELRRERRYDERVPMVGLLVERVRDEEADAAPHQQQQQQPSPPAARSMMPDTGAGGATMMLREGEWRCVGSRGTGAAGNADVGGGREAEDGRETERRGRRERGGSVKEAGGAAAGTTEAAEDNGKRYMAGFYIPHMDKYAFGTDTLVFELHVKVGGAHIASSPFLLAFFNPLLP